MNEQAISFVVAAHDVAPCIGATLDSLLAGAEPDDEIIVVDDGSRDATAATLQAHPAVRAGRVQLLQQANSGVATTRLQGLGLATRPWVHFFDGDDLLQPQALRAARAVLASQAPDLLLLDFAFWWPGPPERLERGPRRSHPPNQLLTDRGRTVAEALDDAVSALWTRIVRRELLLAVMPAHCPAWSIYEDLALSPHLLAAARSVVYLPECIAHYRQNPQGLSARRSVESCANLVRSALEASQVAQSCTDSPAVEDAALRLLARQTVLAVRRWRDTEGSAAELRRQLLAPMLERLGPALPRIRAQLAASGRPGDRQVAAHLRQIGLSPALYALLRARLMRRGGRRPSTGAP